MTRLPRPRLLAVPLAALALVLSACGGGGGSGEDGDEQGAPAPSAPATADASATAGVDPSAYAVVPEGVELTEPGTELAVGDTATVAWSPRQGLDAVLDVEVTSLERTSVRRSFAGYQLDDATRASTPYFVRFTATNVGAGDLSGRPVPLYAVDSTGASVAATGVDEAFEPCRAPRLPAPFPSDAEAEQCLLFFVAEGTELTSVSFVPAGDLEPVLWTGTVRPYDAPSSTERPSPSPSASPSGSPSASPSTSPSSSTPSPSEEASP